MNVIFLTLSGIKGIQNRGIYTDLMRKFRDEGYDVYILTPLERRLGKSSSMRTVDGVHILEVKTLNLFKTNVVEKGAGTILLEYQFNFAIKKFLKGISFDLILYSTPPITFTGVVKALKNKNPRAVSYLLLKDIFPQNAVDLGMFSQRGILYRYFRNKEISLYKHSDYIGCMSPANVDFVLKHNPNLSAKKVEIAPNSIELVEKSCDMYARVEIRKKYNLPENKPIFIYGGNLGKPQGIDFLLRCLEANKERTDCHFLVVGNGTEYPKLEYWFNMNSPQNFSLFPSLPKKDYDILVQACDVGLIFLDHRFQIPNYPSRLLSYLEYKIPIIAATDVNTDIGTIAENNGYGYWCESDKVDDFTACINKIVMCPAAIREMGERGYRFLIDNYTVEKTFQKIVAHIRK